MSSHTSLIIAFTSVVGSQLLYTYSVINPSTSFNFVSGWCHLLFFSLSLWIAREHKRRDKLGEELHYNIIPHDKNQHIYIHTSAYSQWSHSRSSSWTKSSSFHCRCDYSRAKVTTNLGLRPRNGVPYWSKGVLRFEELVILLWPVQSEWMQCTHLRERHHRLEGAIRILLL